MTRPFPRSVSQGMVAALSPISVMGLSVHAREATPLDERVTLIPAAAAHLIPAFEEIGERFEQKIGVAVDLNVGSTDHLIQQIIAGAPVDVFATANDAYIDQLDEQCLTLPKKALYTQLRCRTPTWRSPISRSSLIRRSNASPSLTRTTRPMVLPPGRRQTAYIWDSVRHKLVMRATISDTVHLAQVGNVDIAIVTPSLSLASDGEWTLADAAMHEPIDQALAVTADTAHEPESRAFAAFVSNDTARDATSRYGFVLPREEFELNTQVNGTPTG